MAHTPGPWGVENDRITSKYGDIAALHFQSARNRIGFLDADDARLIAAAPELLACLQSLRVVFASLEGWRDMDATLVDQFISSDGLHRVDAAIAKATGKESE